MPSAPGFPAGRPSAQRPAARRDVESFAQAEGIIAIVPAGTTFTEIVSFDGRPDSIVIRITGNPVEIRVRDRGQAPRDAMRITSGSDFELKIPGQFIEARDSTGVGGQTVIVQGRYASAAIDVRMNQPGPSRERPMLDASELATQVPTLE